jgi:hypothetical protein
VWRQVFNFAEIFLEKKIIFIFLAVLDRVICLYLIKIILRIIGQGSRHLLLIGWRHLQITQILRRHYFIIDQIHAARHHLQQAD